eukprot:SAG31_NODE_394_length_16282_cov_132.890564_9_plen_168_part_00
MSGEPNEDDDFGSSETHNNCTTKEDQEKQSSGYLPEETGPNTNNEKENNSINRGHTATNSTVELRGSRLRSVFGLDPRLLHRSDVEEVFHTVSSEPTALGKLVLEENLADFDAVEDWLVSNPQYDVADQNIHLPEFIDDGLQAQLMAPLPIGRRTAVRCENFQLSTY